MVCSRVSAADFLMILKDVVFHKIVQLFSEMDEPQDLLLDSQAAGSKFDVPSKAVHGFFDKINLVFS